MCKWRKLTYNSPVTSHLTVFFLCVFQTLTSTHSWSSLASETFLSSAKKYILVKVKERLWSAWKRTMKYVWWFIFYVKRYTAELFTWLVFNKEAIVHCTQLRHSYWIFLLFHSAVPAREGSDAPWVVFCPLVGNIKRAVLHEKKRWSSRSYTQLKQL